MKRRASALSAEEMARPTSPLEGCSASIEIAALVEELR